MTSRRGSGRAAGFTLIELLVALAIFAVVAVTVYTRSGDVIRQIGELEERTFATWLADNELALLRMSRLATTEPLPTGSDTRRLMVSGRTWEITTRVSDTTHPWLRRVEVGVTTVAEGTSKEGATYALTGFVGRH
jgi:general secretion pathway protein I